MSNENGPRPSDAVVIDRATSTEADVQAAIRDAVVSGRGLTIAENGITRMQIAARRPVQDYDDDPRTNDALEKEIRAEAYAKGIEDAALTVEAYAETRIPTFWAALRHAARQIRALNRDGACSAKAESKS